ncbi:MAG TPA: hypothetical protein VLC09_11810 [Polyangiaceae bacterium]|nr:hypothetical protein [Polyangiaceae bacterium]
MLLRRVTLLVLLTSLALACGTGSTDDGAKDDDADDGGLGGLGGQGGDGSDGGELPTSLTMKVGVEGGELTIAAAKVKIPAGALKKTVEITVDTLEQGAVSKLPELPESVALVSKVVRLQPHGLQFEQPVEVEIGVSKLTTRQVAIKLAKEDDDTWESVQKVKPGADKVAKLTVKSFSLYAIADDPDSVLPDTGPIEVLPNGYYVSNDWHGFGSTATSGAATVTSDVAEQSSFPHCFSGAAGNTYGDYAELNYTLQESTAGGDNVAVVPTQDGLMIDTTSTASQLKAVLHSATQSWCAWIANNGRQFIPYENFNSDCLTGEGQQYAMEPLESIGIRALSDGETSSAYDVCFYGFSDSALPAYGYLEGTNTKGYGYVGISGLNTAIGDNLSSAFEPPYCINGNLGADAGSSASLGFNLNEALGQPTPASIVLPGDGLLLETSTTDSFQKFVLIGNGTSTWCTPLFGGAEFVPWADLRTNCDGTGAVYGGEAVTFGEVRQETTGGTDLVGFCVSRFDSGVLANPGYVTFDEFHGYGTTSATVNNAAIASNVTRQKADDYCAQGTIWPAAPGIAYASMTFNVAETVNHTLSTYTPQRNGITFEYTESVDGPLYAELFDDAGTRYCAELPGSGTTFFYSYFDSGCGSGAGSSYAGTPIRSLGITVMSDGESTIPYDYCLTNIVETEIIPQ